MFAVMLVTLFAIEQGTAQTDSQTPSPALEVKTESPHKNQTTLLPAGEDPENRLVRPFIKHLALDQEQFWTAPFHLHWPDAKVLAPFAAFTATLLANDAAISRHIPDDASQIDRSKKISEYATYSLIGVAGGSYLWGHSFTTTICAKPGF